MTDSPKNCVIIGASHAGVTCAQKLRRLGWTDSITVFGDEPHLPYHRPPLSKDYLKGAKDGNSILLCAASTYEKTNIDLQLGERVDAIDRESRQVLTSDGRTVRFDQLVIATGARARKLSMPGSDLAGVCYLRSRDDVDRIRAAAKEGGNAVVVGGGYIGLEVAASLQALGMTVTCLEAMDRVLQRVTSDTVSQFFTRVHGEEGIDIRTNSQVTALVGSNEVAAVTLDSAEEVKADLVVIGVGVQPNDELAQSANLQTDNGICVDEHTRTEDPAIYAIGDCANFVHCRYNRQMRLESVQNANDQALTAAQAIVGDPQPYTAIPWFWSDQFDVKLQIAGLNQGADELVIRGDATSGRQLSVLYLKQRKLIAVDAMNRPRDFVQGKKLILDDVEVDSAILADDERPVIEARI